MNDGDKESVETFTASLSTTDSDVNIVNGTATITIIDNDGRLFLHSEIQCKLYIKVTLRLRPTLQDYLNLGGLNYKLPRGRIPK